MEGYEDFKKNVLGINKKHPSKINNSIGVYDIYKRIRKNKWENIGRPLLEKEFYSIIRGVNKLLAEEIVNGKTVKFPYKMGKIELRKIEVGVKTVQGKLKITYPVDWQKTLELWYQDKEAMQEKVLVRNEEGILYKIKYNKYLADYENQCFYAFQPNRFIKRRLSKNIKARIVDSIF